MIITIYIFWRHKYVISLGSDKILEAWVCVIFHLQYLMMSFDTVTNDVLDFFKTFLD